MTVGVVSCMLLCWGVVLQVILASSPYSSELLFPAGVGLPPGLLLCVRVCRPRAFGFFCGRENKCVKCIHG